MLNPPHCAIGGLAMRCFSRRCAGIVALVGFAPCLGACSDSGIKLPHPESLSPAWFSYSGHAEELTSGPPGPAELIDAEGHCATRAQDTAPDSPGQQSGFAQAGIALQMTECQVVRRAGAPERVELGTSPAGQRSVVFTYTGGTRPGIYRFASGRLVSVERTPEPPPSPRQPKTAQAKKKE